MANTTNLELTEIAQSNTFGQWLSAFNANMEAIDGLPIPMEYGENTQMKYLKFTNGIVIMWGRVDFGTNYPCNTLWASNNYASADNFTIDLPIALVDNKPAIFPSVIADKNPDMWCLNVAVSYTQYKGRFLCAVNDTNNVNSKIVNLLIIGKWK